MKYSFDEHDGKVTQPLSPPGETPRTDVACQDEPRGPSVNADFARQLERELRLAQERIGELEKAVFDNLPYLENLIRLYGHESILLREHPQPCVGHDFCLMRQAQKGADALRAVISDRDAAASGPKEG